MRQRWWALPAALASAALVAACGGGSTGVSGPGNNHRSGTGAGSGPNAPVAPQNAPSGSVSPTATPSGAPAPSGTPAPSGSPGGASVPVMTATVGGHAVLTNSGGRTLYWFAADKPGSGTSACYGGCAAVWPPVTGHPAAAPGTSLPKGFGTITRTGGQAQATYDGHPLYTYAGDSKAGQDTGNARNLNGGLWWAMTPTGSTFGSAGGGGHSGGSGGHGGSGGSGGSGGTRRSGGGGMY